MLASLIISLGGCVLTALQAVLILMDGEGLCLTDGCEIVDSLTIVPPLYFNIAGFCFFLLISLALARARKGSETSERFASLLLLAAIAAEGVLVSFQMHVAEVFCSYCLVILALIVLASIFLGIRQIFKSLVLFSAVFLAFNSLKFVPASQAGGSLAAGTMATYSAEGRDERLTLFFSSSCTYCEKIIELLKQESGCSIAFNPIDTIESFDFPGAMPQEHYQTEVNRSFLRHLGISEIPVLLSEQQNVTTILKGEKPISTYISKTCLTGTVQQTPAAPFLPPSETSILPLPGEEEGCSIEQECLEQTQETPAPGGTP